MTKKPTGRNAVKTLKDMKLEAGTELGYVLKRVERTQNNKTKNTDTIGEVKHSDNDQETFNPS